MKTPDIQLYTASTMNGWKPLIFLHEADVEYELIPVDFDRKEQKRPEYLALNPNGRIPTIVDRGNDDFVVFESGAILWYLAEKYGRFLPSAQKQRSETLQWIMFQMGGVGPMMGQAMYFQRIARPNGHEVPFAITRYIDESRRLLEVLDRRLAEREFLVGDDYTIADMATYPYARSYPWANVSVDGLVHLQRWFATIDRREKTQAALQRPEPRPAAFGHGDIEAAARINAARYKD
ncbi:MAG: glutathione S-transferase N-terminal domain-containing protein [Pseudomonadota bacterium]